MATESERATAERRRHPRVELIAQVHVKQAKAAYVLELRNISRSGAFLMLGSLARPSWIDVDRVVELSVVNPVTFDPVDVRGRVVRVQRNEDGLSFAVEFVDLSEETQAEVDALTRLGVTMPPPVPAPPASEPPPTPRGRLPPPLPKRDK